MEDPSCLPVSPLRGCSTATPARPCPHTGGRQAWPHQMAPDRGLVSSGCSSTGSQPILPSVGQHTPKHPTVRRLQAAPHTHSPPGDPPLALGSPRALLPPDPASSPRRRGHTKRGGGGAREAAAPAPVSLPPCPCVPLLVPLSLSLSPCPCPCVPVSAAAPAPPPGSGSGQPRGAQHGAAAAAAASGAAAAPSVPHGDHHQQLLHRQPVRQLQHPRLRQGVPEDPARAPHGGRDREWRRGGGLRVCVWGDGTGRGFGSSL